MTKCKDCRVKVRTTGSYLCKDCLDNLLVKVQNNAREIDDVECQLTFLLRVNKELDLGLCEKEIKEKVRMGLADDVILKGKVTLWAPSRKTYKMNAY